MDENEDCALSKLPKRVSCIIYEIYYVNLVLMYF